MKAKTQHKHNEPKKSENKFRVKRVNDTTQLKVEIRSKHGSGRASISVYQTLLIMPNETWRHGDLLVLHLSTFHTSRKGLI